MRAMQTRTTSKEASVAVQEQHSLDDVIDAIRKCDGMLCAAKAENRIWDRCGGKPFKITINRSNGFEEALALDTNEGVMLYFQPLFIEDHGTDSTVLLLLCDDMLFIKDVAPSEQRCPGCGKSIHEPCECPRCPTCNNPSPLGHRDECPGEPEI